MRTVVCVLVDAVDSRAVNDLLGKYICSILPARTESETIPARRERQLECLTGRTFLPGQKKKGWNKKSPWSAACGGRQKKVSQEKHWINAYDIYLSYYLIRCFIFSWRKASSYQIFQRRAVVDLSRWLQCHSGKLDSALYVPSHEL